MGTTSGHSSVTEGNPLGNVLSMIATIRTSCALRKLNNEHDKGRAENYWPHADISPLTLLCYTAAASAVVHYTIRQSAAY